MIELAKRRHPNVTFYHADICEWDFPKKYDLISAGDSIWHLPLADQDPVLRKILRSLTSEGVCIFTKGGLDVGGFGHGSSDVLQRAWHSEHIKVDLRSWVCLQPSEI